MLKKSCKKNAKKFHCEKCDFYSNNKNNYEKHLQTKKHNAINAISDANKKMQYSCVCGKSYKQQPSLSRHMKVCKHINDDETPPTETADIPTDIQSLTKLVTELVQTNKELQSQLVDMAKEPKTVINNQNNSFNLNNFLNVQCRDAMNLSEFLEQINISFEDLLYLGNNGFVESFKQTFVKQLKDLDQTKRPIHCTDQKRKACVVKEDDKWHKDDTNEILYKAVDKVNRKQIDAFSRHAKNRDKDFLDDDTNLDNNSKIIIEMCGYNQKNADAIHKKIMKHISENTSIKKSLC